jgi:hypothetical protein
MDYDDELRLSCAKTGDLLHRSSLNKESAADEQKLINDFEEEMEDELDNLLLNAQSKWAKIDDQPKLNNVEGKTELDNEDMLIASSSGDKAKTEKYDKGF